MRKREIRERVDAETDLKSKIMPGDSEMARLMRLFDWTRTPLKGVEHWSPTLRMMVPLLLANRFPMLLWWGPQFIQLYNDAYVPVLGDKHPQAALGQPFSECWSEVFHVVGPLAQTPFEGGPATWMEDIPLEVNRFGFIEETHFTIAYSPVPDETAAGGIGGVLATVHEISEKVVGERRTKLLRDLGAGVIETEIAEEACARAGQIIGNYSKDIPFALLYLIDPDRETARLAASSGLQPGMQASPNSINLNAKHLDARDLDTRQLDARQLGNPWPLAKVIDTELLEIVELSNFEGILPGPWSDPQNRAAVLPIRSNVAHQLAGFMVAGLSPRLQFNDAYRGFLELASAQVATAIATARAYEAERKRAEALAEIDRVKTTFFSNVSHEFRTPLTLMLSPIEEMQLEEGRNGPDQERLNLLHRNALRLLKLVNTLLDFSRIEAGRVQAVYQPTELTHFTKDLVSFFRSATDRAGLYLRIECDDLEQPVYVDREMWEKIVLNLLSNAFKFTFNGGITIRMRENAASIELTVQDTGVGIAESDLPRLFERFHRVEGTRGRSFEGSGIGLALVQELVKLHGGTVSVESSFGHGSSFKVSIPKGCEHLPQDRIGDSGVLASPAIGADAYVQEALRWVPALSDAPFPAELAQGVRHKLEETLPRKAKSSTILRPTILIADDNSDMREYLERLLAQHFRVIAVPNGKEALYAAYRERPDLILSDAMMPILGGFGLLEMIRANDATKTIPFILLSARAGEEARLEGIKAGADDYLIKPFSARELLARIHVRLEIARLRRENEERLEESGRRLFLIADTAPVFIAQCDRDLRFKFVNRAYANRFGLRPEDCIGKRIPEIVGSKAFLMFEEYVHQALQGLAVSFEVEIPYASIGKHFMHVSYMPEKDSSGDVIGFVAAITDISRRKQAEEALRRQTQQFETLLNEAPLGVYLVDNRLCFRQVNPVALPTFGNIPDLIGRDFDDVIHIMWRKEYADQIVRIFRHTLESGEPYETPESIEYRIDRDVMEYYEWRIDRILLPEGSFGIVCYFRDISVQIKARIALQEQETRLRKTEKIAAAGQLAASLAHEINNPLSSVTNTLYLLQHNSDLKAESKSLIDVAAAELARVSRIVSQSLSYYRIGTTPQELDLGAIVEESLQIFSERFRRLGVDVTKRVISGASIAGFADELRQVIDNLLLNSVEAMPGGGRIRVAVGWSINWRNLSQRGVRLTIQDTGRGIAKDCMSTIFDPFFTTKPEKGTGLGLWVVYGIVAKHEGTINIRSTDARDKSGTAISIFLPIHGSGSCSTHPSERTEAVA
ncbi:MAG TPA: ATP-binding protein [Candidatus Angelobacter sp.]|nr:ATP-binding protein [Candidatus Angelobacter sp.]